MPSEIWVTSKTTGKYHDYQTESERSNKPGTKEGANKRGNSSRLTQSFKYLDENCTGWRLGEPPKANKIEVEAEES